MSLFLIEGDIINKMVHKMYVQDSIVLIHSKLYLKTVALKFIIVVNVFIVYYLNCEENCL